MQLYFETAQNRLRPHRQKKNTEALIENHTYNFFSFHLYANKLNELITKQEILIKF